MMPSVEWLPPCWKDPNEELPRDGQEIAFCADGELWAGCFAPGDYPDAPFLEDIFCFPVERVRCWIAKPKTPLEHFKDTITTREWNWRFEKAMEEDNWNFALAMWRIALERVDTLEDEINEVYLGGD